MPFEYFDHTADVGLRVRARDLPTLFADAGRGLAGLIVENADDVLPVQRLHVELRSDSVEDLLFDWLSELIFTFETRHFVLTGFEVQIEGSSLFAAARGEAFDPARHHVAHEVKAVTYHDLKVLRDGDGWLAEVILDI
jgi:SHS2 domain-containing protein